MSATGVVPRAACPPHAGGSRRRSDCCSRWARRPPPRRRAGRRVLIDDFEDASRWEPHPSDGVRLTVGSDAGVHGRALRLDFAFSGGGYALVRRAVDLDLPENYRLRLAVRGQCLPNDLELKLIDASGDNVWWHNRRSFTFPTKWDSLSSRKRQITFAWGPVGGGEIHHVAAIEIAVTAGSAGPARCGSTTSRSRRCRPRGRAAAAGGRRVLVARGSRARAGGGWGSGHLVVELTPRPATVARPRPRLRARVRRVRDRLGGRTTSGRLRGGSGERPRGWRVLRTVRDGNGGRDYLYLPEGEARRLRIRALSFAPVGGMAIAEVAVEPLAFGESFNRFYEAIARAAPRGTYRAACRASSAVDRDRPTRRPRGVPALRGRHARDRQGRCSIEPFLFDGRRLIGWNEARVTQRLPRAGSRCRPCTGRRTRWS